MATQWNPVTWTQEDPFAVEKLQKMVDNDNYLYENLTKSRYAIPGMTRDKGVKMIVGKTPFTVSNTKQSITRVYFGSFFTPNTKPAVTMTIEGTGGHHHGMQGIIQGHSGEVDHTGFIAVVGTMSTKFNISQPGWLHWQAVGI